MGWRTEKGNPALTFLEGMREFASNITRAELERAIESGIQGKWKMPSLTSCSYLEDMAEEPITIKDKRHRIPEAAQMRGRFDLQTRALLSYLAAPLRPHRGDHGRIEEGAEDHQRALKKDAPI